MNQPQLTNYDHAKFLYLRHEFCSFFSNFLDAVEFELTIMNTTARLEYE